MTKPEWRIVRYQRVIDPEKASYPISGFSCVKPSTFAEHLRYYREECAVVPLDQLVSALRSGEPLPERAVAITLDGGWIDSFVYAFRELRTQRIPATIFLPTQYIGTDRYLWPDMVLLALLAMQAQQIRFVPFSFFSQELTTLINDKHPGGVVTPQLVPLVLGGLLAASPLDRHVGILVLCELAKQSGAEPPVEPAFAGWEEVDMMASAGINFGSMGHSYAFYHELSRQLAITDMEQSSLTLRRHLSETPRYFAFPEGYVATEAIEALDAGPFEVGFTLEGHVSELVTDGKPILPRLPINELLFGSVEQLDQLLWHYEASTESQPATD